MRLTHKLVCVGHNHINACNNLAPSSQHHAYLHRLSDW